MRFLLSLCVLILFLVCVSTADAGWFFRRGACSGGSCAAPQPTAAKDCAPGCKCRDGGKCICGEACPNLKHQHTANCQHADGDDVRFMQRGPVRRVISAPVRGVGRLFGCRGCS